MFAFGLALQLKQKLMKYSQIDYAMFDLFFATILVVAQDLFGSEFWARTTDNVIRFSPIENSKTLKRLGQRRQ